MGSAGPLGQGVAGRPSARCVPPKSSLIPDGAGGVPVRSQTGVSRLSSWAGGAPAALFLSVGPLPVLGTARAASLEVDRAGAVAGAH